MTRFTFFLMVFIGSTLILAGCGQTQTVNNGKEEVTAESEPSTPLQWIYFEGEKYELNRVVSLQEINRAKLTPTGIVTGRDDGFLLGQEIFLYEIDGSIFAVDDTGPTEEWVNFTK